MRKNQSGRASVGLVIIIIILLCIIGFLIWWFGFHNNTNTNTKTSNSTNTAAQQTAEKAAISSNWIKFFNGKTPADQKVALLQNGSEFAQVIQAQSQSQTAQATTAKVGSVTLNGSNTATVNYTIDISGQPALQNQKGQAVLENGTWKVSDTAFCGLLQLSGTLPPNCPGASSSGSSSGTPPAAQPQSNSSTSQQSSTPTGSQ